MTMNIKMRIPLRALLSIIGTVVVIIIIALGSVFYTKAQLKLSRSLGVFPDAETGMLELINQDYVGIQKVEVVYAGPNYDNGKKPFVAFWMEIYGFAGEGNLQASHPRAEQPK